MKLLSGNSNRALSQAIADHLDAPLTKAQVRRFADMEVFVEIQEIVRGADTFVIQSTSYPANDNLMELLICIDALKRASARRITGSLIVAASNRCGPRTRSSQAIGAVWSSRKRQCGRTPSASSRARSASLSASAALMASRTPAVSPSTVSIGTRASTRWSAPVMMT